MKKYSLKELREKNKWTLEEVGKKMGGVSRQAISCWEKGERVPQLENVIQFLKIYGVKFEQVDWLRTDKGKRAGQKK